MSLHGQVIVAYWDQNSNDLPSGAFGFTESSFPLSADVGAGTLSLGNFNTTISGVDNAYLYIQSFGGTDLSALDGVVSGGSLSPQGGDSNSNNGMYIDLDVDLSLYSDITVSWDQRGTSSGFASREFSYSTNGVDFAVFETDSGTLSSSWVTETYDLTSITALNGASDVTFRITLDGATGSTGNNRFDNLLVTGNLTAVPEPSTVAFLIGLCGVGVVLVRRRRRLDC